MRALLAVGAALSLIATGLVTAAPSAEAVPTERIAGSNRFATSVEISRSLGETTGGVVYLANGLKFPDALSAGPVVAAEGGDLLLTAPNELPAIVAERIRELAPAEVVAVGSTASIADAVLDAAVAAAATASPQVERTRIGGANRVETSLELLERLRESGPVDAAWIVSGATFPDALVAASVAGRYREAVILDHHAPTRAGSDAWLARVGPEVRGLGLHVAGGEPSVSEADRLGLERAGAAWTFRYAGGNRYETARLINESIEEAPTSTRMLLATGQNFPDALAGAVLSSATGVPMYLSPNACHPAIGSMLRGEASRLGVRTVTGLGSAATLSDSVLQLARCTTPLREQIGQVYGRFPMQRHTGTGDATIDLGRDVRYGQVIVRFEGSGFQVVDALDAGGQHLDSLVGGLGSTGGTALIAPYGDSASVRRLRVTATGPWALELRDLTSAPILTTTASGQGPAVYLYDGPARTIRVDAEASGRFVGPRELHGHWQESSPLAPFPTFPATGQIHEGPVVLGVSARGSWSLQLR
ncbi:Putative cell wall binding repeat 2 [Agrococcus baldri]|uniref:Cell wall binding repeat 2 n=1 Tax=Agrococcus baldri TaxID=153730 RepID=A0AA94KYD0_9MICO|nr:cell wall-binding repeat-containing protein [Agrococcus baldri]SFR97590.1 Putative cell wall binding repeat 2 [Agrococcus baldri]